MKQCAGVGNEFYDNLMHVQVLCQNAVKVPKLNLQLVSNLMASGSCVFKTHYFTQFTFSSVLFISGCVECLHFQQRSHCYGTWKTT